MCCRTSVHFYLNHFSSPILWTPPPPSCLYNNLFHHSGWGKVITSICHSTHHNSSPVPSFTDRHTTDELLSQSQPPSFICRAQYTVWGCCEWTGSNCNGFTVKWTASTGITEAPVDNYIVTVKPCKGDEVVDTQIVASTVTLAASFTVVGSCTTYVVSIQAANTAFGLTSDPLVTRVQTTAAGQFIYILSTLIHVVL